MKTKNIVIIIILIVIIFVVSIFFIKESYKQNICVCMSYTDNIKSYSELAEKINRRYCNKNGYDFRLFKEIMFDRAPQWCKIKVINELLSENKYEYIFWIDSDAFFNKQDIKIENIIKDYGKNKDIIICDDKVNSGGKEETVNTGTIIIKCSEWSKNFFQKVYDYQGEFLYTHYHEQRVIEDLIKDNFMESKDRIQITHGSLFNSEINKQLYDKTLEDNFVIHLAAQTSDFRIEYMKNFV